MRLMIIRHGVPDYDTDTLTETGWKEARALAERMKKEKMDYIYLSPMGRAQETASCTLEATGRKADATFDWLHEFPSEMEFSRNPALLPAYPDAKKRTDGSFYSPIAWDILPRYWTNNEDYFDRHKWRETPLANLSDIVEKYDYVTNSFDALLAKHGYRREGNLYLAEHANTDTLVFFCHFGLACVLMSHLFGISPYVAWHSIVLTPTSVTTIYTEEREKGIAYFRAAQIGDVSHLYAAGIEPAFIARFCETYDDQTQRH